ncbi:MAG: Uma2 family endonuclease [Verrucomicrobia bacterium]|nr:Uma2 family endonuclease [Verrucomicrobiota bacterium]
MSVVAVASPDILEKSPAGGSADLVSCPPLENGDRLTRKEFERRYEGMPHVKKAELIEGVVYMGSPVRIKSHSKPHGMVLTWLGAYSAATPGTDFGDNGSLRLDLDNEPQPDAYLRLASGGRSQIDNEDYLLGAPELIVEIAASSASIDFGAKRSTYRPNGVQAHLVWRTLERTIDWWELVDGDYRPLKPDANGVIENQAFPGLRPALAPLLNEDLKMVLEEQQRGLQSEAHRSFARRLGISSSSTSR